MFWYFRGFWVYSGTIHLLRKSAVSGRPSPLNNGNASVFYPVPLKPADVINGRMDVVSCMDSEMAVLLMELLYSFV